MKMKGLLVLFAALIPRVKEMDALLGEALLEICNRMSDECDKLPNDLERDLVVAKKECERLRGELVDAKCELVYTNKTSIITAIEADILDDVISDAISYYGQTCFCDHCSSESLKIIEDRAYEARAIVKRLYETE